MALNHNILLLSSFLFFFIAPSIAGTSFRPKALLLPVSKDPKTLQHLVQIRQRTPLVPVKLTLDLGGQFLWVDCTRNYVSSSYRPVRCNSAQCKLSDSKSCTTECYSSPKPGCYNNTCGLMPGNSIGKIVTGGDLGQDVVAIQSTDGSNPGKLAIVRNFMFTCGSTLLLDGLAGGVAGMAGLGRTKVSVPPLFSSAFSFRRKFAVCLSSSSSAKGVVFFGDGPYNLLPGIDVSKSLLYTPLILNPVSTAPSYFEGDASSDYFIGVKSIRVNGKVVSSNKTLLSIDKDGNGGTKISTTDPYTVLETSIYKAVTGAFAKALSGVPRAPAFAPFSLCFNSKNIGSSRAGPAVPQIDLVLQSSRVVWKIFGANSMVQAKRDVLCLGMVDGGAGARTSVVIGAHQLEENLIQVDLAASKLGFSSSLLLRQTTCSNFNFTTKA